MKRIAIVYAEFLEGGLPSALHVNARSDTDIDRWTSFVAERSEITHVAYEFTTGSGRAERRKIHARWLARLGRSVNRALTIVVRGGFEILPILTDAFESVVVLETSTFMKTMKRQRAVIGVKGELTWERAFTATDATLDDLFEHNIEHSLAWTAQGAPLLETQREVAA